MGIHTEFSHHAEYREWEKKNSKNGRPGEKEGHTTHKFEFGTFHFFLFPLFLCYPGGESKKIASHNPPPLLCKSTREQPAHSLEFEAPPFKPARWLTTVSLPPKGANYLPHFWRSPWCVCMPCFSSFFSLLPSIFPP